MWDPVEVKHNNNEKNRITIHDIVHGKYPVLLFRNFYDRDFCRTIAERITNFSSLDYGSTVIKQLGIFLMAYVNKKDDYFRDATSVEKSFRMLFENVEDPRKRIHEMITNLMGAHKVSVAEDNGRNYSAGVVRIHETGDFAPLHRDNVMIDACGFSVALLQHQLSLVLYIQQSECGGELVLYDRMWKLPDERFREIGFGYSKQLIHDNTNRVVIKAGVGDLIIINPRYFHEILKVNGKTSRITFGMFMAFNDNESSVVTWS
ncbi:MAG: hypothetical protein ACE5KA_01530 [Nitrososphaerales archaeon]